MFWKRDKRLEIPKKDYCDSCGKFSLIKLTKDEGTYACGTTIKLQEKFDNISDLLTISKFCAKAIEKNIDEEGYIIEVHKQKLKWT